MCRLKLKAVELLLFIEHIISQKGFIIKIHFSLMIKL